VSPDDEDLFLSDDVKEVFSAWQQLRDKKDSVRITVLLQRCKGARLSPVPVTARTFDAHAQACRRRAARVCVRRSRS
jgi:hypothetical protein